MKKRGSRSHAVVLVLLITALLLSGCFPKKIMADDKLYAPAPKQITEKLYSRTVGMLVDEPAEVGEVWLLPTPTPVPDDLFDKVFGKARDLIPTIIPAPAQRTERWGTVTVPALNVRSEPNPDADVIAGLTLDQRVKVEDDQDGWLKLTLPDGAMGWSVAEYFIVEEVLAAVETPEPLAPIVAQSESQIGVVLADSLNVRSAPSTGAGILGSLTRYQCVDVTGEQDGWFQISTAGVSTGWSSEEFIMLADECPPPGPVDSAIAYSSGPVSEAAQPAPPAAEPTPTVPYAMIPMSANAMVIHESYMHECFGGGWDQVRFVSSNTPVEVIGVGPWTPPGEEANRLGAGPYVKIRIWDGQYGWIGAEKTSVDVKIQKQISGVCEEGDRIDWSVMVKPTPRPTPIPRATPQPVSTIRPPSSTIQPTPINPDLQVEHKNRDE